MGEFPREYYDLQALLRREGYKEVAEDDNYIWCVLDYLSCQDNKYTIFDWLKDTKENYPDDLSGYTSYGYCNDIYNKVGKMIDEINDFTDSIKAPRIPMRIGTLHKCDEDVYYVIPIDRVDRERFNIAMQYVLNCLW